MANKLLILYMSGACPYCERVVKTIMDLGFASIMKNIAHQPNADELVRRGGKKRVPYLVDEETGVEMYESKAIIEYLKKKASARSV